MAGSCDDGRTVIEIDNMKKLFRTVDGKNYFVTFVLICSLFLLWGFCNGMIDVLNKHFQNSLGVSKTGSALVQFANYMGYFFMAIPAGMLARRFGYKGGILIGLALIATGAFWFIPATAIGTYWAFLTGLFVLGAGLTCLETIANPYTTVLGSPEMGAARINLAQSTNSIGWILGPYVGGSFFLSSTAEVNRSNDTLYKPYMLVGIVVAVLFIVFAFSKLPDLQNEEATKSAGPSRKGTGKPLFKRWHFNMAVVAQFLYVAAQTGIFSFFVNYIITDMPLMSQDLASKLPAKATYSAAMFTPGDIKDIKAVSDKLQNDTDPKTAPVTHLIWSRYQKYSLEVSNSLEIFTNEAAFLVANDNDVKLLHKKQMESLNTCFNRVLSTNAFYSADVFAGVSLSADTRNLIAQKPEGEQMARLNRALVESAFPENQIARSPNLQSPIFRITEQGAALLLSCGGFVLFLLGRFCGSAVLGVCKAHTTLAVFSIAGVISMILVVQGLGWISVGALFASFFFMSIMFPTIFALGIHGLGDHTKLGSSLIVMSIVGGAIMPLVMGKIADVKSMATGFMVPAVCFAGIALYAALWRVLQGDSAPAVAERVAVTAKH